MRKGIFTILLLLFAGLTYSFLMNEGDDQRGSPNASRQIVERVMDGYNLKFNREVGQTSIIFQLAPQDSIKIFCPGCARLMPQEPGDTKGSLLLSLRSIDEFKRLDAEMLNKWIKIKSTNGKVGIIFERDGFGEKVAGINEIRVWRKTKTPSMDVQGVPVGVVDVNNIYIDKLIADAPEEQMRFSVKLRNKDLVQVTMKGVYGTSPDNVICNMYKQGEEFDKTPIAVGSPFLAPEISGGVDQFFFEFSHIEGIKGVNTYHIDVERIPANSTGYLDVVEDSAKVDSAITDTVEEEFDPFLKYLELMQGAPDFTCTTPETKIEESISGRLILGPGNLNRTCVDIPLTDECIAGEDCEGCESIWAFWIGAGDDIINRYNFKDSTRRLTTGEGLIEAWARSRKYRGSVSSTIFPEVYYGEDIFFAIIDSEEKMRFLSEPFDKLGWPGDYSYTISQNGFTTSFSSIMKYSPERPVSLCLCNDNALTTVPAVFRFQQFLTEPKKGESAQDGEFVDDGFNDVF